MFQEEGTECAKAQKRNRALYVFKEMKQAERRLSTDYKREGRLLELKAIRVLKKVLDQRIDQGLNYAGTIIRYLEFTYEGNGEPLDGEQSRGMVGSDLFWKILLALERSEIMGMGLGMTTEVKKKKIQL